MREYLDNFRNIFFKFRIDFRNILTALILSLGFVIYNRELNKFPRENLRRLPDLNLWSNKNNNRIFQIVKYDNYAAKLWIEGHCKKSIQLQKEIHMDYYNYLNLDMNTHFPNCMSSNWTYKIGHFHYLNVFLAAQKMRMVPAKKRILFHEPKVSNLNLLDSASSNFQIIRSPLGIEWSNLPAVWHLFERLNIIKTEDNFMHIYELVEQVMDQRTKSDKILQPLFQLNENYVFESLKILKNLGLSNDKKFIGLHIRNIGGRYFLRNQSVDTYLPAIKFIISQGFQVIRIGNPSDDAIPPLKGFIDLTKNQQLLNKLDAYILANCEFFIGTNSGPANIPQIFGVPTLFTNMTSLGKNIFTSSPGSKYIPKTFIDSKNKKLSLSQILNDPVTGYSELNYHKMKKFGFKYQNNSSDDILLGVIEMLDFVHNSKVTIKNSNFSTVLNQIYSEFEPIGRGIYSESYLEKNNDWFLRLN